MVIQPFSGSKQNHGRLEDIWKNSNPTSSFKQGQCWLETIFLGALSTWVLKTIEVGDCKTSLGILFHFLILLIGERFHQTELSCFSLYLLFLICYQKLFHSHPDMPCLCVYSMILWAWMLGKNLSHAFSGDECHIFFSSSIVGLPWLNDLSKMIECHNDILQLS